MAETTRKSILAEAVDMGEKIIHNRIRCKLCGDVIESYSVLQRPHS
jgi:hypothetical protein